MQSYRLSIIGFFFFWTLSLNAQIPGYYSDINFEENGLKLLSQLSLVILLMRLLKITSTLSLQSCAWTMLENKTKIKVIYFIIKNNFSNINVFKI